MTVDQLDQEPRALKLYAADPLDPSLDTVLAAHAALCQAASPPGSCHFLDRGAMTGPGLSFWAMADETTDEVIGCGALKQLGNRRCELKTMHTLATRRGEGLGRKMLEFILMQAAKNNELILLETGAELCTDDAFGPARRLYQRAGFELCDPFEDYAFDPYSVFMQRSL